MFKQVWIELDQEAFDYNIALLSAHIQKSIALVVKANGYGHGLIQVMHMAESLTPIHCYVVANLSEALELKACGAQKPILVFGIFDEPLESIEKNIIPIVDSLEQCYQLDRIGKSRNSCIPIHLKIDTGLHRFGIYPSQLALFINELKKLTAIRLEGLCSHFAKAYDDPEFTQYQLNLFLQAKYIISQHFPLRYIHMGNSTSSILLATNEISLARVGTAAYGLLPSLPIKEQAHESSIALKQVLTLKTRIIRIKQVSANQTIGYNRTFYTQGETTIALLPIGYSHGLPPELSNTGFVVINNQVAPIIGNIAMNITMVDITNIPGCYEGQEVIIFSDHPAIRLDAIAFQLKRNVREIMTRINPLIARVIRHYQQPMETQVAVLRQVQVHE